MRRVIQSVIIVSLLLLSSLAYAQYEEDPYIEGYVGGNFSMPMGHLKNDVVPDSLNATNGFGLDIGIGYYLKPNLITGLYFNVRNMGADEIDLNHRMFEFGAYGKYLIGDFAEKNLVPYFRLSAGLNFSKLATKVEGESGPIFRELSYDPTLGTELALGAHYKTNDFGGIFAEAAFHFDMTDGATGEYKGINYEWGGNDMFVMFRLGILFNVGPKE